MSFELCFWKTLRVLANIAAKWAKAPSGRRKLAAKVTAQRLRRTIASKDKATEQTLSKIEDADLEKVQSEIAEFQEAVEAEEAFEAESLTTTLDKLITKAEAGSKERAKEEWTSWVAEVLKGGAREAHRFTNQDNALPPLQLWFKETCETQEGKR